MLPPDPVVIGFLPCAFRLLEQTVISLRVEQSFLIKAGSLKLVIHIRRNHKILFLFHQFQQLSADAHFLYPAPLQFSFDVIFIFPS